LVKSTAGRLLRELKHHRHGPERLGEPAGAGGLLADASEPERDRLVLESRGLTSHAELDDHEVGALERLITLCGQREVPRPAGATHHPIREGANDGQPLGVDVQQHEIVHREAVAARHESLDELRRVRAPAADDRHLHTHAAGIVHSPR
jgi:hypothetical protein